MGGRQLRRVAACSMGAAPERRIWRRVAVVQWVLFFSFTIQVRSIGVGMWEGKRASCVQIFLRSSDPIHSSVECIATYVHRFQVHSSVLVRRNIIQLYSSVSRNVPYFPVVISAWRLHRLVPMESVTPCADLRAPIL
jgi:hypothetical protein